MNAKVELIKNNLNKLRRIKKKKFFPLQRKAAVVTYCQR